MNETHRRFLAAEGNSDRAHASPIVVGLLIASVGVAALAAIVTGLIAWRGLGDTQRLGEELAVSQGQQRQLQADLIAAQSALADLESRLVTQAEASSARESERDHIIQEIRERLNEHESTLRTLSARLDLQDGARTLPAEVRLTVARQRQGHKLSCESSAASMVAHYHGVGLSEADVIQALPLDDNPHLGFRGNIDGATGGLKDYGVYAGPLMKVLNDHGLQTMLVSGGPEGIQRAIARGNPVIAWITYNCQTETPTVETISGQSVTLVPFQHAVVVTGYNSEGVWANDPWDGEEDLYSMADLTRAMGYFDNMAIEVAAPLRSSSGSGGPHPAGTEERREPTASQVSDTGN
jgi:uncharacterized protein YvpB